MRRPAATLISTWLFACAVVFGQNGSVKITAPRANVRAEPSEKGAVLTQVTAGTSLVLKAIEGEWFRIELPADPRLGGSRVEAFVSKKVAALVSAPVPPPAAPVAVAPPMRQPTPPLPSHDRNGMSVALQMSQGTSWIMPETSSVRRLDTKSDSISALATSLPTDDASAATPGNTPLTFVCTLPATVTPRVVEERQPIFIVVYKNLPGVDSGDVTPMLVRLTSSPSGVRVFGVVKARADQATRADKDWNLAKDIKQDVVKTAVAHLEPGTAKVTVAEALLPGDYALVVRPSNGKRLSGEILLAPTGMLATVFPFSVK